MRATGVVRRVDSLGRVVIPMDLRRSLEINEDDPISISVDGENVVLRKFKPYCTFCGGTDDITVFKGKNICAECFSLIKTVS